MPQYIAFLRGINVGGHRVKMEDLRRLFEALDFQNVSTFIASGNVIFEAAEPDLQNLERKIEDHLENSLGYSAAVFIRTLPELLAITRLTPFKTEELSDPGHSLYISLLRRPLPAETAGNILSLRSAMDDFHIQGREIYWLCRGRISDSPIFKRSMLDKALKGIPSTMRNITSLRKLVAKYQDADGS